MVKKKAFSKKISMFVRVFLTWIFVFCAIPLTFSTQKESSINPVEKVSANSMFQPTTGEVVVGTTATLSDSNVGSWRGAMGTDDNKWLITRIAAGVSLDLQITFGGVTLQNANKFLITIEDTNVTTGTNYRHQICDWTSSTSVDNAADAKCTGGGWRNLHPRATNYTNTTDTSRTYEIYDGYFSTRSATPGTVISTPLTNFINGSNNVLIRAYSDTNATTQYALDYAQLEVAIDPVYEPASLTLTAAGTTTNFISDLTGANSTNLVGSDGNKMTIPQPAGNQAADFYFSFKNVRTYNGANTIVVMPEACVSNVALTFGFYLWNFNSSSWIQATNGQTITGTACTTDTEYSYSYNSTSVASFDINNFISNGEVRFRILTAGVNPARNIQLDRVYMMLGSVNNDTSKCEISWGTGTATNCSNTRSVAEAKTANPIASTWQATAALEYPSSFYSLDNDDDAVDAEYATSQNLSFPFNPDSDMSVTAIHYAVKYRSNSTAQTMDLGIRDYSGINGTSGWVATPGTDTNALTTYGWFDTWVLAEYQTAVEDTIDSVNNLINLRARTSAGSTTNPGTRDWSFAMMSVRWTEESQRSTLLNRYVPTGGNLVTGTETATGQTNTGSWKGAAGNDSGTNSASNYWTTARINPGGTDKQLIFDGVKLYNSNKIILTIEDTNITTGNAYTHQICDWVSSTGVDNAADAQCTTGGWRTLTERLVDYTNTSDTTKTYEIYDGYFSDRGASPGTVRSTPISNFVEASNKRVLIRIYSTVASTVQHRLDYAQIELAADSIYEPNNFTKINSYAGATSNFLSDIRGTGASDANKLTFTNASSNPMDFYFSFTNVISYSGANTLLVKPEICVSNVALTFNVYAYNFTTTSWSQMNGSTVTGTACATDTAYAYVKNNVTLSDYISNGEVRIRFVTSTLNTNTFQIDRIYMMLGSTNTDTSLCEVSTGTGTATNCTGTRDVSDAETGSTANTSTWQNTSVLEYQNNAYPTDNDDDTTTAEGVYADNLSFPLTLSSGMSVKAIHWGARFRSNVTTMTVALGAKDFGNKYAASGWTAVGTTSALTTYNWTDSWQSTELNSSPYSYINTNSNLVNLRLRTSVSTILSAGTVNDWDFAMVSLRWVQDDLGTLSVDIVDSGGSTVASPSISFGNITTNFNCQTSTGTFGVSAQKIRVYNTTDQPSWTLSISANGGNTSTWNSGVTDKYDFNDSGSSGCGDGGDADSYAGQLSLDFSSASITPGGSCSSTGLSFGSNAGFVQGTTDSVTVLTAGGSSDIGCYWDITNISVSQKIPSSQAIGNYSIPMSLTIVAN